MTTWFTSDLHLGHSNIIRYCDRPFVDVKTMNQGLVDRWNDVVADDDIVWVLGDVAMGHITESLALIDRLKGRKHLVSGNHDRCFDADRRPNSKAVAWQGHYLDAGFAAVHRGEVQVQIAAASGGINVRACHFPFVGDSGVEDRYLDHRPVDDGSWLLHGHVHERWRWHRRMINVGVDAWDYAPVPEATLAAIIAEHDRTAPSVEFALDGATMRTISDVYDQVGDRLIPGRSWGRNLDAFADVLRGGFGTPDSGCTITWRDAGSARDHLGGVFTTLVEIIHEHGPGADRFGRPTGSNIRLELR